MEDLARRRKGPALRRHLCFADRATAQAYVDGPIVARIKANTALADLQIRVFDVRARQSEITHAPVPGLAKRLAAE